MVETENYENKPYWKLMDDPDSLEEGLQHGDQGGVPHAGYSPRNTTGRKPNKYDYDRQYSLRDSQNPLERKLTLTDYIGSALDKGGYSGYLFALQTVDGLPVDGVNNIDGGSNPNRALYAVLAIYGARQLDSIKDKRSEEYKLVNALVEYCVQNAGSLLEKYNK